MLGSPRILHNLFAVLAVVFISRIPVSAVQRSSSLLSRGSRMVRPYRLVRILGVVGALAMPAAALAQQTTAGIAGVARDASGGVLPGVSVEASSPVLIERVRTVTTDGDGRYNIVDLPPGRYTVTFTLPGFSTIKNEGVDIT